MHYSPIQLMTLTDFLKRWLVLFLICLGGSLLFLWLTTPMARMQAQDTPLAIQSEPETVIPGTTPSLTITIRYTISTDLIASSPFTLYYALPAEADGLPVSQTAPDDPLASNELYPPGNLPVRFWEIDWTVQSTGLFTVYLDVLETAPFGVFTHETWLVSAAAPTTIIASATITTELVTATNTLDSPTSTVTPTVPFLATGAATTPPTLAEPVTISPVPTAPTETPLPLPTATPSPSPTITATMPPTLPQVIATIVIPVPEPTDNSGWLSDGVIALLLAFVGVLFIVGIGGIFYLWQKNRRKPAPRPAPTKQTYVPTIPLVPIALSAEAYLTDATGKQITITDPTFTIGRAGDNHLIIDTRFPEWETVSQYHATISRQKRGYIIEDRGSRNGLRVQGRPTPKNLLQNGYTIHLGDVPFKFHQPAESGGRV